MYGLVIAAQQNKDAAKKVASIMYQLVLKTLNVKSKPKQGATLDLLFMDF